jgi:hypothetical protein
MSTVREKYYDLIVHVCQNVPHNEMVDDVLENIDEFTNKVIKFSNYFNDVIKISIDKSLTQKDKVDKIVKLSFQGKHMTKEQAKEILKRLQFTKKDVKKIKGGGKPSKIHVSEIPVILGGANLTGYLPYMYDDDFNDMRLYGVDTGKSMSTTESAPRTSIGRMTGIIKHFLFNIPMALLLKFIYWLGGKPEEGIKVSDFIDNPDGLSIFYIILFLLANIPFVGVIPNILIIFNAIDDGRIFLAMITVITTFLSLFTLHYYDLGVLFKLLYWLDVKHESQYKPANLKARSGMSDMIGTIPVIEKDDKKEEPQIVEDDTFEDIIKDEQTKESPIETEQPTVETKEPTVETEQPTVETKESPIETEQPTVETKEPTVETEQPTVETKEPTVEVLPDMNTETNSNIKATRNIDENLKEKIKSFKRNRISRVIYQ